MGWESWIREGREVEPSLYAADFTRLGEQIDALLGAGCRVFHFDVGDGHFVPPVTIGPVVLRSIAPMIHAAGGVIDCHLMVSDPAHHFPEFAESGADSVTFHVEATADPAGVGAAARAHGLSVGVAFNPGTDPDEAAAFAAAAGAEMILCMSIVPGYSGQSFMPDAYARIEELARRVDVPIQVDGGVGEANAAAVRAAGASSARRGKRGVRRPRPARGVRAGSAPPRHEPRPRPCPRGRRARRGVSQSHRRRGRRRRRRDRRRGRDRALRRAARRGRGARGGRSPCSRRDRFRDDGAVHAPRAHAPVRRRDHRCGRRAGRRRQPRPESRRRPAGSRC